MAGLEWDNGIATRLVIFQDWPPDPGRLAGMDDEKRKKIRYIGVVKVAGIGLNEGDGLGAVIPFIVEPSGLSDVDLRTVEVPLETLTSPARPSTTRRLNEVPDSEDELSSDEMYGWGEDDELAAEGLLIDEAALAAERSDEKSDQPPQKRTRTGEPASRISPEQE
ncbi:hypothetical protein DIS24_g6683 [Lasiodiplodia hormozganensis]|uniref:Uncharacterized protein n=1 Tax=Lasiodiplodia hormozganensis TaxID=869390 RepID=A0AA39YDX0_9PEZI|nr:hypothetical protein DIS24_g6683 [Lasiodiplodia hormozganensis]